MIHDFNDCKIGGAMITRQLVMSGYKYVLWFNFTPGTIRCYQTALRVKLSHNIYMSLNLVIFDTHTHTQDPYPLPNSTGLLS